jgi:transglutaminase-like putative cysteine protease
MYIRVGYEIVFELPSATPMMALLHTHPEIETLLRQPDVLRVEPDIPVHEFIDSYGNRCTRFLAPAGLLRLTGDATLEDDGLPNPVNPAAKQHPVAELPDECLPFLLASRYCEVDRMGNVAWELFGGIEPGWGRVEAICNWVHQHVTFGYEHARPTKTAYDVYTERNGVCRDYQHLAITLCRCMNIPARYATGYLGEHGVPPSNTPMDFSAWFEAYLGGQWWTWDARHNTPRIGHVLMARGRDATDCALTTSFGAANLEKFIVWSEAIDSY